MAKLKVEGTFHERMEDITFTSGGKKAEFVLEMKTEAANGKEYREFPKFEVIEKFIPMLNNVDVGDRVRVEFSVGGRAWKPEGSDVNKYFTTLKAWDVAVLQKANGDMVANDINKSVDLTDDSDPFDGVFDGVGKKDASDDSQDLPF